MAQQGVQTLAGLDVPQTGRVVHGAGSEHRAVGIEAQAHNLCGVTAVGVVQLACLGAPQFASLICVKITQKERL